MKNTNLIKIITYAVILLVVLFLVIFFFRQVRIHEQAFRNITATSRIDETMPIGFVVNKFGIPESEVLKELQLRDIRWNHRYTIADACKKNKLDCASVVNSLNEKISR